MKTKAVLLLNLGGPDTLKDVKPFLFNLFSDPDILVGMPGFVRIGLAFLISQTKGRASIENYRKIGGGSPQRKWTEQQARLLEESLEGARVFIGMRAWKPTLFESLKEMRDLGIEEVVILPLFPHFSTTTTGSCFKEIDRSLKKLNYRPKLRKITHWGMKEFYLSLLMKSVEASLANIASNQHLDSIHVLISAHSLPEKIINRGDPYLAEVQETYHALEKRLNTLTTPFRLTWSLAFQSRNGPVPWLKPYLDHEIKRLRDTTKHLLIVPISFVSDHIETLFEIDEEYGHLAKELKYTTYTRTEAFNGNPEFAKGLRELVLAELA